ncbi:hypothetical protein BGW80DRAFT_1287273 [Lactifluus volemus]|nr:hypothetical protein BGW80DRAFT_1287273 [Lactifluus volemus]
MLEGKDGLVGWRFDQINQYFDGKCTDDACGITPLTSLVTIADPSTCSYRHSCIHHDELVVYY